MSGRSALLSTALIILVIFLVSPNSIHPVKGQLVGLVCLSPSNIAQCPAPPVTVSAPVGSQMSVYVIIQGSDGLDGFDITLVANHTIIKAADASFSGSLLSGGMIIGKCIGGILKAGTACAATDTVDTVEFSATAALGSPNTFAPTTGLLFAAIYNVTGTTTTPITFQTGCAPSSIAGTTTCVVVANGTPTPIPETLQAASYAPAPTPTFTIGTGVTGTEISIAKGTTGNSTITLTSLYGFAGSISLSTTLSPNVKHPPTVTLSSYSVILTQGQSYAVVLSASAISSTTRLVYTIAVTGASGLETGSVQIQLSVASR